MKKLFNKTPQFQAIPIDKEADLKINKSVEVPIGYGQLPVDILENDKEILLITPLAGVDLDTTEIIINNDTLTIKGCRMMNPEDFGFKLKDYYIQECFWGDFSRSVILPSNTDTQMIEATQKDHVLRIRIPKRRSIQMKIIKIKN